MTISITTTVLMILAFIFLLLAALNVALSPRVNLGWLGMAILVLVFIIAKGLIG